MILNQVLRSMVACAALLAFVSSAHAFENGFSGEFCEDISSVPGEVRDALESANLAAFGPSECKRICREAKQYCETIAENRKDCFGDSAEFEEKFAKLQCDVAFPVDIDSRKQCRKQAGRNRNACGKADKKEFKSTVGECGVLRQDCRDEICG